MRQKCRVFRKFVSLGKTRRFLSFEKKGRFNQIAPLEGASPKKSPKKMEYQFGEDSHDPDGHDPAIEDLIRHVTSPFESSAPNKKTPGRRKLTDQEVDERIEDRHGGWIVRTGGYHGRRATLRCQCVKCGKEILKRAEDMFRYAYKCDCEDQ